MDGAAGRFNAVSWLLCTAGVTVPFVAAEFLAPHPGDTAGVVAAGTLLGWCVVAAYLSLPYWIYHRQVNRGETPGAGAVLLFLAVTGVFPGILLVLVWDLVRLLQSKVMELGVPLRFGVSSPGLLRRR